MLKTDARPATLQNVNLRIEKHGKERVLAADLKIGFQLPSSELDSIEKGLTEMLYRQPTAEGDQLRIEEPATAFTVLKHPSLEPVRLKGKFPGYELTISDPNRQEEPEQAGKGGPLIDGYQPLFLVDVEVKKITVDGQDGGTALILITASMPVDADEVSECSELLEAGEILLTLTPPSAEKQREMQPPAIEVGSSEVVH